MSSYSESYVFDGIEFTLMRLEPKEKLLTEPGDRIFLMQGAVVVADFVLTAPRLIVFGTQRSVEAVVDRVYLCKWTHPEVANERQFAT